MIQLLQKKNNLVNFGLIKAIFFLPDSDIVYFLLEKLETVEYCYHLSGFKLKEIESPLKICQINEFLNPWPLDLYDLSPDFKFVMPKYPL